jgi:hypothetical protein
VRWHNPSKKKERERGKGKKKKNKWLIFVLLLCGLVVRVPGYRTEMYCFL